MRDRDGVMHIKASYRLAFAAVCVALGTLFLTIGFFVQAVVSLWVFLGSLCVMLSLETGFVRDGVLTHIAITLLSLIFNGFNFIYLIPYIYFMGVCPIVSHLFEKTKMPRLAAYLIKHIWFTSQITITTYLSAGLFGLQFDSAMSTIIIIAICIPMFFFYNLGMVNIRRRFRLLFAKINVLSG